MFGQESKAAAVGRIDVQPHLVLGADLSDFSHWIHAGRRRGPDRRHDRERFESVPEIGHDGFAQSRDVHPKLRVAREPADIVLAQSECDRPFLDRTMGLVRNVNAKDRQLGAAGETQRPHRGARFLAGDGEGVHGRDGGGVVDHTGEIVRQAEPLPQPIEDERFQLGARPAMCARSWR